MTVEQGLRAEFHDRPKVLARALRAAREQGVEDEVWSSIWHDLNWGTTKEGYEYWEAIHYKEPNPERFLPKEYVDVEDEQPKSNLFTHLQEEHGLTLLGSELDEIRRIVKNEVSPWIMVEDGLPDHENNVLAVLDGKVCVMAYFSFKDGGKTFKVWGYVYDGLDGEAHYNDNYEPTKWMEIPKP